MHVIDDVPAPPSPDRNLLTGVPSVPPPPPLLLLLLLLLLGPPVTGRS